MTPIKRNCIQTFQLRSNYAGIPFVVALIGALFVVIAYALNKHHAWNAFSKHPVALGGSVVGVFVLSIIGSLLQRRYDQKQLLAYLSRKYVLPEDQHEDQRSQWISAEIKRIAHLSLSEAIKEFHRENYNYLSINKFPVLKAYIEKGVPADLPLEFSSPSTADTTLLGIILKNAGAKYYCYDYRVKDSDLKDKDKAYIEAEGESVKEMLSFLLKHRASVNGLSLRKDSVWLTESYAYRKGVDRPLLTLSFMNYFPNKCEIIELMMQYHPDFENVQIEFLLGFLFYKKLTSHLGAYVPTFPIDRLVYDEAYYRNPSEEEINQTMKLVERLIAEGAPYIQKNGQSILLVLAGKISSSHYGPCKSRLFQAIVNGETKKQKSEQAQLRTTLLERTKISKDVIDLIAGYAIELPELVFFALKKTDNECEEECEV